MELTNVLFTAYIMKKLTDKVVIQARDEDGSVINIEVDSHFIEFYKKETGHSHVTKKGVTKFLNRLIELHKHNC